MIDWEMRMGHCGGRWDGEGGAGCIINGFERMDGGKVGKKEELYTQDTDH